MQGPLAPEALGIILRSGSIPGGRDPEPLRPVPDWGL